MDENEQTIMPGIDEIAALRAQVSALKNADVRFRKLFEQSRDGIVILDSGCKVYEANQKFADMLGYNLEEVYDLYAWDWDKNLPADVIRELARDIDEKGHHFDTVHTRKDGSVLDVELSNSGTMDGDQKLIFCICRDITDRKHHEAQLKESKELLGTFIDNFQGIAYQVAMENIESFTPRLFSGAVEQITGYPPEEFSAQRNWNSIVHPDDSERLQTVRRRFRQFPDYIAELEYRIIGRDGSIHWVRDNAKLVKIGLTELLHGTIFDITRQKQSEEEKLKLEEQVRHSQKLEAIGTLAGGVAHDFNNILNIIMGYTELVLNFVPEESSSHSHLIQIQKATNRAKDIIYQLLTFSRKVGLKKKPLNVTPVIAEALSFLRSTLPSTIDIRQNITIKNEMILADPTQIHQVIMNLCVNAAQSMETGEGIITVAAVPEFLAAGSIKGSCELKEGNYIKLTVSDNGSGIPPEIADRIFEPYFTTRANRKGSGMGLAVVHGIVENHSGCIFMTSMPGEGTAFTMYFPVVKYEEKMAEAAAGQPLKGAESILLVDDEEDITIIGKLLLEDKGFRVQAEVNPLDALDAFRKAPEAFDLVFTDMTMPYLTGDALFREVRKIRADIPVVLCTGHSDRIDEESALAMGINAYMNKPLRGGELIKIIRSVLDKASHCTVA